MSAVALLAAGVGLFLLALVVIFVFWDTHRVIASIAVTGTFFLIAVVAALVLRAKTAREAAAARCDDGRAQEGPRPAPEQALRGVVVSDRVKELASATGALAGALRRATRGASRTKSRASKRGSSASIASLVVARTTLLHPVVIGGGIVALLTVGRLRGMRLIGRLYLLSTAARRLLQHGQSVPRARSETEPGNAQGAAMSVMRSVVLAGDGRLRVERAGAAELRADAARSASSAASTNPEDLVLVPGTPWIVSSGMAEGAGFYLVDSKAGTATLLPFTAQHDPTFAELSRRRRRRSR